MKPIAGSNRRTKDAMDPDLPLDDDELDELDAFLHSAAVGEDAMDVSMLDGFLTALAVGPNNLAPSLWLPEIWGQGVTWPSDKIAERMRALVLRHANCLLLFLREEPEAFEPLLLERDDENQKVVPVIEGWCIGFVRGMALDEASWKPLLEDDENGVLLDVILLHGTEHGMQQRENDPTLDDEIDIHAAALAGCVAGLMAYWLPQRKRASTLRREAPKVGRNDDCPCGSGKKFKKCCGAEGRLH
jgi:uncharacterized protein